LRRSVLVKSATMICEILVIIPFLR
jgi:hypothetical protein